MLLHLWVLRFSNYSLWYEWQQFNLFCVNCDNNMLPVRNIVYELLAFSFLTCKMRIKSLFLFFHDAWNLLLCMLTIFSTFRLFSQISAVGWYIHLLSCSRWTPSDSRNNIRTFDISGTSRLDISIAPTPHYRNNYLTGGISMVDGWQRLTGLKCLFPKIM